MLLLLWKLVPSILNLWFKNQNYSVIHSNLNHYSVIHHYLSQNHFFTKTSHLLINTWKLLVYSLEGNYYNKFQFRKENLIIRIFFSKLDSVVIILNLCQIVWWSFFFDVLSVGDSTTLIINIKFEIEMPKFIN